MTDLVSQLVGALAFYADPLRYGGPNQRPIPGDKHTPDGAPYMVDMTRDGGQIARAALTAAKAGGWVPIETAPKDGRRVMVAIEGVDRAVVSFWSGAGWATVDGHDWQGRPVTAWQPLPNPPKEQS